MQENNSLRNKFEGFKADPSPQVWENIERSLDEKKRRRGFIWWWAGLAASLIFGLFVWTNSSNNSEQSNSQKTTFHAKQKANHKTKNAHISKQSENRLHVDTNRTAYSSIIPTNSNPRFKRIKSTKINKGSDEVKDEFKSDFEKQFVQNNQEIPTDQAHLNLLTVEPIRNTEFNLIPDFSMKQIKQITPLPYRHWEMQLLVGGATTGREEMMIPSNYFDALTENQGTITNGTYPIVIENPAEIKSYRNVQTTISGLISYTTKSRFRFSSGISYQRFYTQLLETKKFQAEMHLIQVPLLVDYSFNITSKWRWDVGTGIGMGYGFNKHQPIDYSTWRTDFLVQSSVRYALSNRFSLQLQPQARIVFWDSQKAEFGKVSPWYLGGTLGGVWSF